MAELNMTSMASALKQTYTPEKVKNMVYADNPLFALMPKMENFVGKNHVIPVIYGNPQGRSAAFANAQANKTASKIKDFTITTAKDYSLASIDNETILASKNNSGAFMSAITLETDGAFASAARSLAIALYGSGTGKIGKISAINTLTITLSQPSDVVYFEVGQKLNASTADGGGSVKSTKPLVTAVDRNAGTVTVEDVTGWAQNDYLFQDGDYDSKVKGLAAWLPSTVSPSDNFFGMNRSVDVSRLAGIQYDGSASPIEEALISAASRLAREGGKPTHCFMAYEKFAELEKSLGSKIQYVDLKADAEVGFRGILINGPRGPIKVVADQNCPADKAFMLQLDTWKLLSRGPAPQILNLDGLDKLRDAASDSIELRVGYYAQLSCHAPGYNAVISF